MEYSANQIVNTTTAVEWKENKHSKMQHIKAFCML